MEEDFELATLVAAVVAIALTLSPVSLNFFFGVFQPSDRHMAIFRNV